jgi:hypothetical protein
VIAGGLLMIREMYERGLYVVDVALEPVSARVKNLSHVFDDVYSSA